MEDTLKQKVADIKRARKWARSHFNAYIDEDKTPSTLLDPHTFSVEFPDVDRLAVCKIAYGQRLELVSATYRLAWLPRGVAWVGGPEIRPDIVAELYIDNEQDREQNEARKALMTFSILGALARRYRS